MTSITKILTIAILTLPKEVCVNADEHQSRNLLLSSIGDLSLPIQLPNMIDVNFICERGGSDDFIETDCGSSVGSGGDIADFLISTAFTSCVASIIDQQLDFSRPDYDTNVRGLRRKKTSSTTLSTTCRECPCDSRECCDMGYCTGSACCSNCSCKRRELLLGGVLQTTTQTMTNVLYGTLELTTDLLETILEETCTISVRLVASTLLDIAGNKCLGENPWQIQCHSKVVGL